MRFPRHGSWFLRLHEDNREARATARAACLAGVRAIPFRVACAWHENVQGPNVTHTICPACLARMVKEFEARGPSDS